MKKRIALITIAICLAAAPLWAGSVQDRIKGVIAKTAAAPTCSETPTYSNTTTDFQTYYISGALESSLSGGKWNSETPIADVCRIDVYVKGKGDVDALTWQIEHSTGGDASHMGTVSSTSETVAGTEMPADTVSAWVTFTFASPITIAQGDAITIVRSDHSFNGTNCLYKSHDYNAPSSFFYLVTSQADGTTNYSQSTSHGVNIKVYCLE